MVVNNFPSLLFCLATVLLLCCCSLDRNSKAVAAGAAQKVAGVNLGGWLVIEKWMRPSLWDGIPESELLDGSQIQLKSTTLQTYVAAESGGGSEVVVNRTQASSWETFKIWRYSAGVYSLRVSNKKFMTVSSSSADVTATASIPFANERFTFTRNSNRVHIQASNGKYLQAKDVTQLTADFVSSSGEIGWDDNAATFEINITSPYHGEYQLANWLGPEMAPGVFKEHWESFVTESDFEYLSGIGINMVRIPVGYWIASDPNPPKPFVSGSLQVLDNAFDWAERNNIKIMVDLHAVPGSQNGQEHSATIDGVAEWASGSDADGRSYIDLSLNAIDFLASRYGKRSGLYGIELLNEPVASDVPIDILKSYYRRGYAIVRNYSDTYVVLCQLLGAGASDFVDLGTEFQNAILDLHYYNMFEPKFDNFSVQDNIDYININRRNEIESLNQNGNGLLTFVGEWTNKWATQVYTQTAYQAFGQAQLNVYGEATAGWSYWNYKIDASDNVRWDFRRSYDQEYILKPDNGWNP